jgi:hypothetical protein
MKRHTKSLLLLALGALLASTPAHAQSPAQASKTLKDLKLPRALPGGYNLSQFGPIDTPANAAKSFAAAEAAILAAGGGVLIIPVTTAPDWRPLSTLQNQIRIPEAPAPASKTWRAGPGYTIVDLREPRVLPPSSTGVMIKRQLKIPQGQSLPHWTNDSLVRFRQSLLRGGSSFQGFTPFGAGQGLSQKLPLSSVQGLFPGQVLYTTRDFTGPAITVQAVGYDAQAKSWYATVDTTAPVPKGSPLYASSNVAGVQGETWSHNENQTFDMMIWRHNFSQGTNQLVKTRFHYMGDNQPYAPDGGTVLMNARSISDIRPFTGKTHSYDAQSHTLIFTPDSANADTLGSGRPIINLNPAKCLTAGSIFIMNPGGALLNWGGSIRFTPDAPITTDNIGDYIAITTPSETIPGSAGVPRWYLISNVDPNTRSMSVVRHWWGAKPSAGISRLYKGTNYTSDVKKPVLLSYIVAPGNNVYDASAGAAGPGAGPDASKRALRLAPGPANGTPRDFAPGDPITQAVGPDPFVPITLRSWIFEDVPSAFPAPVLDIRNFSRISRYAALRAGNADIATNGQTFKGPKVAFNSFIEILTAAQSGITFKSDVPGGGFIFDNPAPQGRPSLFSWKAYIPQAPAPGATATQPTATTNSASPASILENLTGASKPKEIVVNMGTDVSGQLVVNANTNFADQSIRLDGQFGQASSSPQPGSFRQIAIPVPKGKTTFQVATQAPVNGTQVLVTPSWMTSWVITSRGKPSGFTLEFDRPAPDNATLSWMIIN